jgi:hypothetical protein
VAQSPPPPVSGNLGTRRRHGPASRTAGQCPGSAPRRWFWSFFAGSLSCIGVTRRAEAQATWSWPAAVELLLERLADQLRN